MNFEKLDNILKKYELLNKELLDQQLDKKERIKKSKEIAQIESLCNDYLRYKKILTEIDTTKALLENEKDEELKKLAEEELENLNAQEETLQQKIMLGMLEKGKDDDKNVMIEIRAGAGGDEAALFAARLMRMYKAYAEKMRYKIEDIDISYTELGGVKEAIFSLRGSNVYGNLKFEGGVHRVQRVPTTETQGRIHTSTVTVAIIREAEDLKVELNDKDLKIDTYRSGGAGGQHVNKTESAIRITHLPTGIIAQCQDEKSQIKNKEKAMKVLKARVYEHYQNIHDAELSSNRKMMVGRGDRSERIRTYNFPQGRVTDHRISYTLYDLDNFLNGDIGSMIEKLKIENNKLLLNE